jgi:hypothetical protein
MSVRRALVIIDGEVLELPIADILADTDLICPTKPNSTLTWVGGRLTQVDYSDGRQKTFSYNGLGQLYQVVCDKIGGGQRQIDLTYNSNGTLATITRTDI